MNYIKSAFKDFKNFQGTTDRKSFWIFFMYVFLLVNALAIPGFIALFLQTLNDLKGLKQGVSPQPLSHSSPGGLLLFTISMVILFIHALPLCAITIRRLRDAGFHPAYILLILLPIIGPIVLLYLLAKKAK